MADQSKERSPFGELFYLALPTVAQTVSYTVMQFIDTWMLSRLGTDEPTAAGNAGILAFAVICFGFGIMLCVNTLASQSYGRGEFHLCGRYMWQGIWVGSVFSLLALPIVALAPHVFAMFDHPQHIAALEAVYLRIVLLAMPLKMISTAAGQFLLATNRPKSVLVAAVSGVAVNAIVAYMIVLGRLGAPKLGVAGAAWAQNAGVFVEMCLQVIFALTHDRRRFSAWDWRPRVREAMTLVRIGIGSGLQIVADVLAWSLFLNLVMAKLGGAAMAANQFMFRYMIVSFMPAVGISQAVTALVGRYIGMRRFDLAMQRANLGFRVAAIYMFGCGILMIIFRYPMIKIFTQDVEVVRLGAILLVFAGIYQLFDAMYVVYNGALRGAGDTLVPAVVTAGLCWGVTVGGGYLIAKYFPALGVAGPWIACTVYGIALGIFCVMRFRRGAWQAIHLEQPASSNVAGESARLSVVQP